EPLAELTERHPVELRARRSRRELLQRGKRLFLDGNDGDRVSRRPSRTEHQEGEAAVAGYQAKAHRGCTGYSSASTSSARRMARRRMTPRWDVRMNSIRYSTSLHARERSRWICCIALVVFSFDC